MIIFRNLDKDILPYQLNVRQLLAGVESPNAGKLPQYHCMDLCWNVKAFSNNEYITKHFLGIVFNKNAEI